MDFDLTTIITTVLGLVFTYFGGKWGLKKIIMGASKWAKALNPVAKELDEALTTIGQAAEDGDLSQVEMVNVFKESKDVWEAAKNIDDLVAEKKAKS
jgi:hypothetical protein